MRLRRPIAVRLHQWKRHTDPHNFYFAELELYFVFKNRKQKDKCHDDLDYCKDIYEKNLSNINYVKSKAMPFLEIVEEGHVAAEGAFNEEMGELLDPENEQNEAESHEEEPENTDEFISFDYDKVPNAVDSGPSDSIFKRVEVSSEDSLITQLRNLDPDQRLVVNETINYLKIYKRARIVGVPPPEPFKCIVTGGAGSGKSHVINLLAQWTEHLMRKPGDNLDHPYIVRTAFSGIAGANIGGQTCHTAFSLDFGGRFLSLNDKKRAKLQNIMCNVRIVIIDEYSMLPSNMLYLIDARLREIKQRSHLPFGGVSVILFGDPMQLEPVKGRYPWKEPTNNMFKLYNYADPLWEQFKSIILKTNHRQGCDGEYAEVLNRARIDELTDADVKLMKTRVVPKNSDKIPKNSVYIFARNAEVNEMNEKILEEIDEEEQVFDAIVRHPHNKAYKPVILNTGCIINTNLMCQLKIKIGSIIMITYNLNVADGITNGTLGEVMGFQFDDKNLIQAIHIHLFDANAGVESSRSFSSLKEKYGKPVVVIKRYEHIFSLNQQNLSASSTATAINFPIRLASSLTSHKVQGQTIKPPKSVVLNFQHARKPAQVYVMLSRAQKLDQVFIIDDLYLNNWKASYDAMEELERLKENSLNKDIDPEDSITIASLNCHSLRKHFDDVKLIRGVDVFCIQETWLTLNDNGDNYQIANFNLNLNSIGNGRGIATYYPSQFKVVATVSKADLQITKLSSEDLDILNIYRSQGNKTIFNDIFPLVNCFKKTVAVGDFNLDIDNNSAFLEQMRTLGLRQLINSPTQELGNKLDHIYVNFERATVNQRCVYFSDHDLIKLTI